jgi:hypothetical protein
LIRVCTQHLVRLNRRPEATAGRVGARIEYAGQHLPLLTPVTISDILSAFQGLARVPPISRPLERQPSLALIPWS